MANFRFSNNTTPPPLSGDFRFNATQASATILYVHHTTNDNQDVSVAFDSIRSGDQIYCQDQNNSADNVKFNVTGTPTDAGTYTSIPVSVISSGAAIGNNQICIIQILREGVAGPQGPAGAPGVPGMVWRGAWSGATAYAVNDVVGQAGSSYICITPSTGNTPPNASYWNLVAQIGATGAQGVQGNPGSAGATGATGAPGIVWRGAWNSATAYAINDVVSSAGSSYICISANTNNVPPNATFWNLVAQIGATGTTGATGSPGAPGATGATGQGYTWRGAWNSATAYVPYDTISSAGSSYVCIASNTNQTPPNATYWNLIAQIGNTGAPGATGSTGATGPAWAPGVGFTFRGAWSSATAYAVNDVVVRNAASYTCIVANTNNDPMTDTTHWTMDVIPPISYSTSAVTVPAIGASFSVPYDQINWMMVGLAVALGDMSTGNLLGSFTVTALTPATRCAAVIASASCAWLGTVPFSNTQAPRTSTTMSCGSTIGSASSAAQTADWMSLAVLMTLPPALRAHAALL